MKRKAPAAAERLGQTQVTQRSGHRQPQTSCLNCRVKKIKCDRGAPCSSCVVRGISCTGQPGSKPVVVPQHDTAGPGIDASILSRLASLEKAVFGDARHGDATNRSGSTKCMQPSPAASTQTTAADTPSSTLHRDTERQQTAKFFDLTYTRDDHSVTTRTYRPRFHAAPASSHLGRLAGGDGTGIGGSDKSTFVMTREEALLLLGDFFENPYHILPIVYEPSARYLFENFYTQLDQGQEGDPTAAALILSIASTSASFFGHNSTTHKIFASIEEATQASLFWRQTALAILDDSRFLIEGSLEGCQARAILANDGTLTYPLNVLTQVSCFIQRIRLGEICKEISDARAPGLLDVEITDFNTVTSLDLLFERALAGMPPFLHKGAPIPHGAPLYLAQQRDLILLCFHFRRARLHRPFLLHDTDNPQYEPSRHQCISSARIVLAISIEMLEGPTAVDQTQNFGNPLAYRTGLVITGMFTACAILALNAGLIWNRTTGDARSNDASSEMQGEITRACRILAKAGEKSTFAANLLRNLVGVLKEYSGKDIDDLVGPSANSRPNPEYRVDSNDASISTSASRHQPQSIDDPINLAENFTLWNEFFTTMPEMEGYDELFAGLDFYCGPT
ncbi:hypothetical protein NUW58_g3657 [Xylaria curta]|uniref:Uncharacterized protein n=1 Tax=Xylaria curta TaxID=42375 RepID=A0ACC1PBA3_9PEZI|nr:hypothetical protein NUW58_g3657 [Xylaria curta]